MKQPALLVLAILLFATACNKKKDQNTAPSNNNTNPYYFKFELDGVSYDYHYNFPQYSYLHENEIGGYQVSNAALLPGVGLSIIWPVGDTLHEKDMMTIKGKTFYYGDSLIHPELSFFGDFDQNAWVSVDTPDNNYSVTISDISFLKKDTILGYPLRTYVMSGSCNGVLQNNEDKRMELRNGNFHFIVSMQDWE